MPSQQKLKQLFTFNPETGLLHWIKPRRFSNLRPGDPAGWDAISPQKKYRLVDVNGKSLKAHRIIWTLHYGQIPDGMQIDHIDHNGLNNRLENLRLVTFRENMRNRTLDCDNKSGVAGVIFHKKQQKWVAAIRTDTTQLWLGTFSTKKEAIVARKAAEVQFGFHPNHGRKKAQQYARPS